MRKYFTKDYNLDRPDFLSEITVNRVSITNRAPELNRVAMFSTTNPQDVIAHTQTIMV